MAPDGEVASLDAAPGLLDADVPPDADVSLDAAPDAAPPPPPSWRSTLYPDDWTPNAEPDAEGRFLHDFSYAGYHLGEAVPGAFGPTFELSVVDYGADPEGERDSTSAIADAIEAASRREGGAVVFFPEGLYKVDGRLTVSASHIVLRGAGAGRSRIYFTKSTDMVSRAHLTFAGRLTSDLEVALAEDGASRSFDVAVADAGDLEVGDAVAIGWTITPEFVAEHNMTGTWVTFNGTWQTFFRRTVRAIDRRTTPHRVRFDVPLRYAAKVRDGASLRRESGYLEEVGVEHLGLSNVTTQSAAWATRLTNVLRFDAVSDAWVSHVESFASPNAPTSGPGAGKHLMSNGVAVYTSKRVTIADSSMRYAQNKGDGGNGYLFEVSQSSEVLLRDVVATHGRHNLTQNWGFGTTGMVWLRVLSADSLQEINEATAGLGIPCYSDFHHSLAMANLIDSSTFEDGFRAVNRREYSSGAGLTATESVLWNLRGRGAVSSMQFGHGYVIGAAGQRISTMSVLPEYLGSAPVDFTEGLSEGASLSPQSLYEDQLDRRLREEP